MNKLLLIFTFFLAFSLTVSAHFTISGIVVDVEDNDMITGANVVLENTYYGAVTDNEGRFELMNVKEGNYTLTISFVGYETWSEEVTLDGDKTLQIKLTQSSILTDEVVVTAVRATANSATAYENIDKKTIESRNLGQDLPFLLEQTPSMVTTSDAGAGVGYTGMRIRGTDATRINVTINGIPYNDPESSGTFLVNLPDFASSVDNIQIQRGVGTSTNGAGAFGGSVHLETNTLNADAYAEFNNSYGSFNTWKNNVQFGSGLLNGKFSLDGRLSKITSDGYIDRASSDLKSFYISAGYHSKKSILKLTIFSGKEVTYQAWNGVPEWELADNRTFNEYTYDNQVDDYQQDNYQLHFTHQFNDTWSLKTALHYTYGRGFFEQFKEGEDFSDYGLENSNIFEVLDGDTALVESTDLIRRKWLDNDFYGGIFSVNYTPNNRLNLTLGGGWNNYVGDHFGEVIWAQYALDSDIRHRWYENVGEKSDLNTFIKGDYEITNKLFAFADMQFRRVDYTIDGVDDDLRIITQAHDFNFFNPKVGMGYHIQPNRTVYASYSMGNREPNRGNFADTAPYDMLPKPEKLHDIELGYKYAAPKYAYGMNLYYMRYKDQLVLTGNLNDVGNPIQQNVPDSYRMGVELQGGVNIANQLRWDVNATFSMNKIKEFAQVTSIFTNDTDWGYVGDTAIVYRDTDISFSPNVVAASTLTYKPVKGLEMSLLTKYVGSQFLDNTANEERKLDAYFTNNILLKYGFSTSIFKNIEFSLLVNNVFNSLYESNGYTYFILFAPEGVPEPTNYNYYYPQAGVNLLGGVKVRF